MIGTSGRVAFVDDDDMLRLASVQALSLADLSADPFADAASALAVLDRDYPGVVVTDVRMPGIDGLQLFRRLREIDADLPVILVTGHGDVPMAVAALKDGAWDFLTKPFSTDQLIASVHRALAARTLALENRALRAAADRAAEGDPLIGETPAMVRLRRSIRQLADSPVDVLVEGETGTGKELVATLLHRGGTRRGRPFVAFDCKALSDTLAQSELFGHRDGVVPGLRLSRTGRIESANGGTLYLDELDALPQPLQVGMLRVLEERELTPLGADHPIQLDIRVIASIRQPAATLVEWGTLRSDLFYRMDAAYLRIPPLRERRDDIPLLFAHFLDGAAQRHRVPMPDITARVRQRLASHDWPGNARELSHFADRLVLGLDEIERRAEDVVPPLPERTRRFETEEIRATLDRHRGDVRAALVELGIPRKTFYDKVTRYGITPGDFRKRSDD